MLRWIGLSILAATGCSNSSTVGMCPGDDSVCLQEYLVTECRVAIEAGYGRTRSLGHTFENACDGLAAPSARRFHDAIVRGDLDFHLDQAEACLARGISLLGCPQAFTARVPVGGACDHDFECIDGLCAPEEFERSRPSWALGDCGTCIPFRQEGEECGFTGWNGQVCADGLFCAGAEDRCVRLAERGDTCNLSSRCGPGLKCVDGSCQDETPNGGACSEDVECGGYNAVCMRVCDATGVPCDDAPCEGSCTAECTEGFRAHGRECAGDSHCLVQCVDGACVSPGAGEPCELGHCAPGTVCSERTCRTEVTEGEACDSARPCAAGLTCDDGRCRVLRAPNESCDEDTRCVPLFDCAEGLCRPAGLLGDSCVHNCRSGACIDGICTQRAEGSECLGADLTCGALVCDEEMCMPTETAGVRAGCPYDQYLDRGETCQPMCYLGT